MGFRPFALVVFVFVSTLALPVSALIEARLGLGYHFVSPDEINAGQAEALRIESLGSLGGDIIVTSPLLPAGLGLRWETLTDTAKGGTGKVRADNERISLIINKRFIDTFVWAGAIGTVGLWHDFAIEQNLPPALSARYETEDVTSVTLGAEAGVNFTGLVFGAELGYQHIIARQYKYAGVPLFNAASRPAEADFSGVYAKLHVGYGF